MMERGSNPNSSSSSGSTSNRKSELTVSADEVKDDAQMTEAVGSQDNTPSSPQKAQETEQKLRASPSDESDEASVASGQGEEEAATPGAPDKPLGEEEGEEGDATETAKGSKEEKVDSHAETFPRKLHRIIDDAEKNGRSSIISFLPGEMKLFKVHKPLRFVEDIMPQYFSTCRMSSFQRQLNLYGFQRIPTGSEKGCYVHPYFVKGDPDLCTLVTRGKRKSTVVAASEDSLVSSERPSTTQDFTNDAVQRLLDCINNPTSARDRMLQQEEQSGSGLPARMAAQYALGMSGTTSLPRTTPSSLMSAFPLRSNASAILQQHRQPPLPNEILNLIDTARLTGDTGGLERTLPATNRFLGGGLQQSSLPGGSMLPPNSTQVSQLLQQLRNPLATAQLSTPPVFPSSPNALSSMSLLAEHQKMLQLQSLGVVQADENQQLLQQAEAILMARRRSEQQAMALGLALNNPTSTSDNAADLIGTRRAIPRTIEQESDRGLLLRLLQQEQSERELAATNSSTMLAGLSQLGGTRTEEEQQQLLLLLQQQRAVQQQANSDATVEFLRGRQPPQGGGGDSSGSAPPPPS